MTKVCSLFSKFIFFVLIPINLADDDYIINDKTFPDDFMFGVSSAAYQIEGGWDADGKGENIWDRFSHERPELNNGDVACDSYNKYGEDVELLKYLGVNHYRFSISWARILPNGFPDYINPKGIAYYENLIALLKANNIQPLVTLYHWDLPQALQDIGGFHNSSFSKWFADYARICFENFGDDVSYWITFNEPPVACSGYGKVDMAPGLYMPGVGEYICVHNLIKAHAAAYHVYQHEFKYQNGKLGIANAVEGYVPRMDISEDIASVDRDMEFTIGWSMNPLYYGDYPDIMKSRIAYRSNLEGFTESRLPQFTEEEKAFIKGTSDYIALNTYQTTFISAIPEPDVGTPSVDKDCGVKTAGDDTAHKFDGVVPVIQWITEHYNKPAIIIGENGAPVNNDSLQDDERIRTIKNVLSRLRDLIDLGINVFGYTVWSLLDNFEWTDGYRLDYKEVDWPRAPRAIELVLTFLPVFGMEYFFRRLQSKYGLYKVDYDSSNRTRTAKASAGWYKNILQKRCLVDNCRS